MDSDMIDRESPPDVRVRVFLVLPAMSRAIVANLLAAEGDITVVGAVSDLAGLRAAVGAARTADVVLVSGDGVAAAEAFEHLGLHDLPAIMAIDPKGTNVELHEVIPRAQPLGDLSPADFVEAVRAVTSRQESPWR
jgi:hypothetical protein